MRCLLIFLFLFYFFPYSGFSQADIVGGEDADIEDYPYQAALLYSSGGWSYAYCGASIINQYWILTAAHCVEGESASNTVVRVGSDNSYAQGGTTYDADEIIIEGPRGHPVQIDGDLIARLPVRIRVARDKVNVYAAHSQEQYR